jgi:hypothetical protein
MFVEGAMVWVLPIVMALPDLKYGIPLGMALAQFSVL